MKAMTEDCDLLRDYVEHQNEAAFTELVHRHINLVYGTATRVVHDAHLAKDVSQAVFLRLARKAGSVRDGNALPGWLYRATLFAAADSVRAEQRRRQHERDAMNSSECDLASDASAAWTAIAPHIDAALQRLNRLEQDAVVLRYFENKSLAAVGRALGLTEEAARKRVSRALDKLRVCLSRRGVKLGSSTLASVLACRALDAAPAGLAAALASSALAGASAGAATSLFGNFICTLSMTKASAALVTTLLVGSGLVSVALYRRDLGPSSRTAPPALDLPPMRPAVAPARLEPQPPRRQTAAAEPRIASLLQRVASLPALTPRQIESYVEQNNRNAESLLAAYRIGTNFAYLTEAAARFPADPDVQDAVVVAHAFPDLQRQWIEAYKVSSPGIALPWYCSALEFFRSGDPASARQELAEASRQSAFRAELAPVLQAAEELHLSAGRAPDEAKLAAFQACCQLPHLQQMRELSKSMLAQVAAVRRGGDAAAGAAMAGMGLTLGGHLSAGGGSQTIINQLVGIAIEKAFLKEFAPGVETDPFGRSLAELRATVEAHHATLKSCAQSVDALTTRLPDPELSNYLERVKLHGEEAALTWLTDKHNQ